MIKKIYIRIIGLGIEFLEKIIFNRKLAKIYREIFSVNIQKQIKTKVIDVGANRGQSAIFFGRLFANHEIYCFEANPYIVDKLKRNTKNVNSKIYVYALGHIDQLAEFNVCVLDSISTFSDPNLKSKYNIFKSNVLNTNVNHLYKKINVTMKRLDYFFENHEIVEMDILKIDVEGFEYNVLKGSEQIIKTLRPKVIQVEIHLNDQYKNYNPYLDEIMDSYNYLLKNKIRHAFGDFFDLIYVQKIK